MAQLMNYVAVVAQARTRSVPPSMRSSARPSARPFLASSAFLTAGFRVVRLEHSSVGAHVVAALPTDADGGLEYAIALAVNYDEESGTYDVLHTPNHADHAILRLQRPGRLGSRSRYSFDVSTLPTSVFGPGSKLRHWRPHRRRRGRRRTRRGGASTRRHCRVPEAQDGQ